MTAILDVVQVFLCVGLIFLILMHSGKDAGLSGAFGVGTGAGPLGGGSLVERNLNRWTILFAVLFVVNTIVLIRARLTARAQRCADAWAVTVARDGPAGQSVPVDAGRSERPGDRRAAAGPAG